MEVVFVYLLYLVLISLACGALCRHESYSNQYPGQGAPPGGSYPNQQPGMYPQQQSVGKQLMIDLILNVIERRVAYFKCHLLSLELQKTRRW